MEQIAIIAHLKPDVEQRARDLIAQGAPFDLPETGLRQHTVYLAADTVVFVFEGHEVEWVVDRLLDKPFQWNVISALDAWRPLVDGQPRNCASGPRLGVGSRRCACRRASLTR